MHLRDGGQALLTGQTTTAHITTAHITTAHITTAHITTAHITTAHITTAQITPALVRALLRDQFPDWAELPVEPAVPQGHDNRTFRLGDALIVRLPSAPAYAAAIAKEDRALPLLAAHVSTPLPDVVATGAPSDRFPLPWSVRRWLPGTVLSDAPDVDRPQLAADLARFLVELRSVPTADGPACGRHSFFRGCHPSVYADEVQEALAVLGDRVDGPACRAVWQEGLTTAWPHPPVWFHGDVAAGNLLVQDGRLTPSRRELGAVIDLGTCGVGDPACDLVVAWTWFDAERPAFRTAVDVDDGTWARGRAWALWKALITLADPDAADRPVQARALEQVLRGG